MSAPRALAIGILMGAVSAALVALGFILDPWPTPWIGAAGWVAFLLLSVIGAAVQAQKVPRHSSADASTERARSGSGEPDKP